MRLYFKFVAMQFKKQMEYKVSFFFTMFGQFIAAFGLFLSVYFMFDRFNLVQGFTFQQVLLCYSTVFMSFSLAECFVRGFDVFPRLIRNGDLDRILLRPKSEIFQVLSFEIDFSRLGRCIQAILVFAYAIPTSEVVWTWDKVLTLVFMILGGLITFASLFMLYAGVSFFTIEGIEFMNIFTDGAREFGRYPFAIYGDAVLKFLTYIIPLALFQYYPLLYLIGSTENVLYMFLPLFCVLFIVPCYLFFKFGLSRYKSTGS